MYCLTVEYIRPRGTPSDRSHYSAIHPSSLRSSFRELPCNPLHKAYSPGRRVLRISKRPEPVNTVHCSSCIRHEPFSYSQRHRPTPKNTLRGNPGCAVGLQTPTASAPGRGVSLTQASSMVVTSQCKIALRPRSVFCFGTISSVADEKGILHRIADPSEKRPSSKISEKVGMRQ